MKPDQIFELVDSHQECLGHVRIEREEGDLVLGRFTPAPPFTSVRALFRKFEEAADQQALHRVEDIDNAIAALGLQLRSEGSGAIDIRDVQIWTDGGFSCRLAGQLMPQANGGLPVRQSVVR